MADTRSSEVTHVPQRFRDSLTFRWEDDWEVDHQVEYDCYTDGGPSTCEACLVFDEGGEVVNSLGCVDDADDADDRYRRQVEDDLAADVFHMKLHSHSGIVV